MKKLVQYVAFAAVGVLLFANLNDFVFAKKVTFGPQEVSAFHPCGKGDGIDSHFSRPIGVNVCYWRAGCPGYGEEYSASPGWICAESSNYDDLCLKTYCYNGCLDQGGLWSCRGIGDPVPDTLPSER